MVHEVGVVIALATAGAGSFPIVADRYELRRVIGQGGFGFVCRARDLKLQRDVAVKVVDADSTAMTEARRLAQLAHPNIVRVHDGEASATLIAGDVSANVGFAAMELLDGETLRSWQPRQSKRVRVDAYQQLAHALTAMHELGFVHGDFKPDNVLVVDRQPILVDFGLSVGADEARDNEGTWSRVAGTPRYLAPESRQGVRSAMTDQFAFASSLWEALYGDLPTDEAGRSGRVERALLRALSDDPAERFESVTALVDAFRPSRARVAVSVVVMTLLVVSGLVFLGMYQRRPPVTDDGHDVGVHVLSGLRVGWEDDLTRVRDENGMREADFRGEDTRRFRRLEKIDDNSVYVVFFREEPACVRQVVIYSDNNIELTSRVLLDDGWSEGECRDSPAGSRCFDYGYAIEREGLSARIRVVLNQDHRGKTRLKYFHWACSPNGEQEAR